MINNSTIPSDTAYHLGKVKWFGGYNAKTERENDFGFIEAQPLGDVFVHKKALINTEDLNEGQLILFRPQPGKKGVSATDVFLLSRGRRDLAKAIVPLSSFLGLDDNFASALRHSELLKIMVNVCSSEEHADEFIHHLKAQGIPATALAKLTRQSTRHNSLFTTLLMEGGGFCANAETFGLETLTTEYIDDNIKGLAEYLLQREDDEKLELLILLAKNLSLSAVLYLIFNGVAPHPSRWGDETSATNGLSEKITGFIRSTVLQQTTDVADFVRQAYKDNFASFSEFYMHPAINREILPLLIKRKIYKKDLSFVSDITNSETLLSDPELWFLSVVIPLIQPELGNNPDDVEKVILHELWQALLSGQIDVNHDSIFKLFPQCQTLKYAHMRLSCEAFHWKTDLGQQIFLCRSKKCTKPEVIPDLEKCYLDYSAFDWLAYYGINYAEEKKPSKKDVSIKLAGYFNRIRELHSRLQCRSCNTLMVPNMKYARVEVTTIDPHTGVRITKPVHAAYRLTVFKCNNSQCQEFSKNYYINHCLHYKCSEIIDSRDLTEKCDEGRYYCPECNSCCAAHSSNTNSPSERFANPSSKHRRLYQDSPAFRPYSY